MNLVFALIPSMAMLLGAEDAKQDLKQLQGQWTVVAAVHEGDKLSEEAVKKMQVTIKDDVMEIVDDRTLPDSRPSRAVLELNASTKPRSVDLKDPTGTRKGETPTLGIYELHGDDLKMCWSISGTARPSTFASKPDSDTALFILKRAKKN
jgi:uncharacterized protein (TIGR03067 family)